MTTKFLLNENTHTRHTCGLLRTVALLLMQPPERFCFATHSECTMLSW